MQLSSQARKAVATGLAASTLLWSAMIAAPQLASAAPHSDGCLVLSGGVVWLITGGTRRGFTSAEVFASHGYNFSQVVTATAEDAAMPVGPIMTYADGTLVMGPNDPLVYLVANGQKRPFTTGAVFTGLGYSFANIQVAPVNTFSDLPTGSNLDSTTIAHPAGTRVISGGAIWLMTAGGRMGYPSASVFTSYGIGFNKVVAANSYDLAMADQGAVAARSVCSGGTTPPPFSGAVSLASDNPASGTLVATQAQADLAHFQFGSLGTITAVTFERIGVSANTTLSNVYLFNGSTRISDSASVGSDNKVTFAGLNIATPANISVRSDILTGTSGQTVGVKIVSYTAGTAYSAAVSGNIHTIATATLATTAVSASSGGGAIDPANDVNVWQGTVTIGTRDVTFNRLALRQIGSISSNDIRNFRLQVDGVQVAQTSNLDANGYVTFVPNSLMKSGARTVKVLADVIGGSGRTYGMSLRGAYDIVTTDSQYNVGIVATGSFPFGPSAASINAGSMSVVKATDSPSSNLVVGATDQLLGKYTFNAFGESIKVETLRVGMLGTTSGVITDATLRNVKVMVNGTQVGSTTDVPFAAAFAAASGTSFTTNFYVTPGTATTVEIRGDMYDSEGTEEVGTGAVTAVQAVLVGGTATNNAVPQVSLSTINVPSATNVTANSLTIGSGSLSLAQTTTYPNQSITAPQSAYKLASWTLTGSANEAVNLNSLDIGFVGTGTWDPSDDLTNVYLKYGNQTTSIKSTVADGAIATLSNTYSVNTTIPVNGSITVELWATIGSSVTATDTMIAYLRATGVTAISGVTKYADTDTDTDNTDNGSAGQTITISAGTVTATLDSSSAASQLVDDSGTVTSVVWKFAALVDSFTVTDLSFSLGSCTAVANVEILDAGSPVASKPCSTSMSFSNLNIAVGANTNKLIGVRLTMSTIGYLAGTTDSSLITTMVAFTARNSSGSSDASANDAGPSIENNPASNSLYAYKAVPLVSQVALSNTSLAGGTMVLAKFTVSSNGTGTVAWKQAEFEISKPLAPTLSAATLWNADTGEQITAASSYQAGTPGVATTCVADNTYCELLITVGTVADDDVVESISGAKTYEIRATVGGTLASGNFVSTVLDRNTAAHANSAAYVTNDNSGTGTTSFTWSDESGSATGDTGVLTWQKDYLIKNLPLTWTLNRS